MCRDVTKGTIRRKMGIEFCIECSRGHSAGHFGIKIRYLAQFLHEVNANPVIQNMHYNKVNILSKLISKKYIQSHIKIGNKYI